MRQAALWAAGHVYDDLAGRAGVTHSMVWKWMHGQRQSARIQAAFDWLLAHPRAK